MDFRMLFTLAIIIVGGIGLYFVVQNKFSDVPPADKILVYGKDYGVKLTTPAGWLPREVISADRSIGRFELYPAGRASDLSAPLMSAGCREEWQPLKEFIAKEPRNARIPPDAKTQDFNEIVLTIKPEHQTKMTQYGDRTDVVTYIKEEKQVCVFSLTASPQASFDSDLGAFMQWVNSYQFNVKKEAPVN